MADVEVRELRYFRAVAEELNFSRAAERLGIAQPPLSRAIRQLERRLGAQLFQRGNGQVTMTLAGLTLFDEAGRALDAVSAAARRTRRAALEAPTLVVTAKPGVVTDLLRRIVTAYRALPGAPAVQVAVSGYGEQADMVRDGRADVALVGSPHDHRGLDAEPLFSEPRVAAIPSGHELAHRDHLCCADLAAMPMPQWPLSNPSERDYWTGRDRAAPWPDGSVQRGREFVVEGPVVHDSSQLLEAVALGQAVALIPTSLADRNLRADIAYRPVSDASPYAVEIVWAQDTRAAWTARFVRTAVEVATTPQSAGV